MRKTAVSRFLVVSLLLMLIAIGVDVVETIPILWPTWSARQPELAQVWHVNVGLVVIIVYPLMGFLRMQAGKWRYESGFVSASEGERSQQHIRYAFLRHTAITYFNIACYLVSYNLRASDMVVILGLAFQALVNILAAWFQYFDYYDEGVRDGRRDRTASVEGVL